MTAYLRKMKRQLEDIRANLKVTKKADGQVSIDNVNYIPLYIYKNPSLSLKKFKLIDLRKEHLINRSCALGYLRKLKNY